MTRALVFSLVCALAWIAPAHAQGDWTVYDWNSKSSPSYPTGALAQFDFNATGITGLTTTSVPSLLGNLTGKTLTATLAMTETGTPVYTANTQCPPPPFARFFLSTSAKTYSISQANKTETNYWWSNPTYQAIPFSSATLTVPLTGDQWSDANGHFGNDPLYAAAFTAAITHIGQIGFQFAGGCFFDTGIRVTGGTSTFTLDAMSAQ